MNTASDPVTVGLACSMARPGGNVTGFWWGDEGLNSKRLELLKAAIPSLVRVGFILHPEDPTNINEARVLPEESKALGLTIRVLEVRAATDFEAAFATAKREDLQGLNISTAPLFVSYRAELAALAAKARLPAICGFREFVVAGGLASYGASLADLYRRKAAFIDKILKGANPAEMPIERPTKFEFLVNLKTAKAFGLTIPQGLLDVADEVVE